MSALVDRVDAFSLFQRTAQWIMPQENPRLHRGRRRRRSAPTRPSSTAFAPDARPTCSTSFANAVDRRRLAADPDDRGGLPRQPRATCATPSCASGCRPSYRAACKRLIISPDFYEAIQRPNAELVTAGDRAHRAGGVRTRDGRLHELDVLVLATGFRADPFMRPMERDRPRRRRPRRRLGRTARAPTCRSPFPGFPNFFMLNGPNGPVGNFSLIEVAELQFGYILQLVERVRRGRVPRDRAPRARRSTRSSASARGAAAGDGLDHRLQQLVPRRPRHPRRVAVDLRPLPRRDGRAEAGRLRRSLTAGATRPRP